MTNRTHCVVGTMLAAVLALSVAAPLEAQWVSRLGARGGIGIDRTGKTVYVGQVDVTEMGTTHSVELALAVFGARLDQAYAATTKNVLHEYQELTHVDGVALIGSVLLGHARPGTRPYVVAGLGLGPLHVDWRQVSPTDPDLDISLPAGGSFREQSVMTLGAVLRLGVGLRLPAGLDVRAQAHALVVPSTADREDMKVVPTITLSTGVGF